VVAGFSTHPHWDHVLWHQRFGAEVPRYGTAACAATVRARRSTLRRMATQMAPGTPVDLVGSVVALPPGSCEVSGIHPALRLVEHRAHAPGHAAVVVDGAGVLVAGDMLSDVEIPLPDPRADDPLGDYLTGLELLDSVISDGIAVLIPGHGGVARGPEIGSRVQDDRDYLQALLRDDDPVDRRLGPGATYGRDWLPEAHERNIRLARQSEQASEGRRR